MLKRAMLMWFFIISRQKKRNVELKEADKTSLIDFLLSLSFSYQ